MGVYIYDKDTSTLITPQLAAIPAALSAGTFVTTWMLDTTASDDFRLILHIATTNANAYDVYFDDVIVGPGQLVQGFGTQSPSLAGFIQPYSGSIAGFSSVAGGDGTTLYYKDGWALCNGASISQTAYAQLYARVGTTHNSGTDPKTGSAFTTTSGYFRIPNLQGVFLRGVVDYSGSDAYSTDNDVDLGVYKIDKAQGHKHSIVLPNATAGGAAANPGAYFSSNYTDVTPNTTAPRGLVSGEMSNNGVDGAPRYAKETNPKQSGVYYLVKLYDDAASVYLGSGADNTAQMPLNWTAFTPSWTNFTAGNATQVAYYRRVNDQLEVYLKWVLGSSSSVTGTQYLTLPASLLADTNKLTASYDYLGEGKVYDASTGNQYVFKVVRNNTSTSQVFFEISYYGVNGIPISNSGSPVTWATSDEFTARFSVPIVNWTAQQYQGAMLAGFATAGVGTAGLVNNTAGNTAGTPIRGATDGSSATAGYVGEVKTAAANAVSTSAGSSSYVNATDGLTLTAGVWLVSYYQTAQIGSYPATDKGVKLNFDIATNGGTSIASQPNAAYVLKDSGGNVYPASSWTGSCGITTVVSISASTTYYGRISSTLISSDSSGYWTSVATATGGLVAVRIR
jgi:microcystin-dependent protein